MTSAIDPTKPTGPVAYTHDVRANFAAAKSEIEDLQTAVATPLPNPLPVVGVNGLAITQTLVTLTAGADATLIAANASRRSLALMNIDVGDATLGFGAAATVGAGWALPAAAVPGGQGGGVTWNVGEGPPLGAVHAISSLGTRIVVLEGV